MGERDGRKGGGVVTPHLARTVPFDELYRNLLAEKEAGNVRSQRDGDLELFTYSEACVYERRWTPWSLIARGLIVDAAAGQVVATPFPKFFNYGEARDTLPAESFTTTEKLDGSLGIVYHHGGRWRVATKGSLKSDQAKWAERWIHEVPATAKALRPGVTYLTEILYPENRIVIRYAYAGLVLLSAFDEAGEEFSRADLERASGVTGMQIVKAHEYDSLDALLDLAKTLAADREGFVVRFDSGLRIKIKGDEYCRIHRLVSDCTPLGVWEVMAAGDSLERVRKDLPEEFRRDFDTIYSILEEKSFAFQDQLAAAVKQTEHLSDKELGLQLQAREQSEVDRFIFPARKQDFIAQMANPGTAARRKAFMTFRPTGNRLLGYEPSSAMNRFAAEVAP